MAYNDFVSVTIVTYNSGRFIKRCLESALAQKYDAMEIIVIDNNSADGTIDILEQFEDRCRIVYNDDNLGFAAAQNQAIGLSNGDWVLRSILMCCCFPISSRRWWTRGNIDSKIGTVCGKLLTIKSPFDHRKAAGGLHGIYFTPMLRHLDRGSQEVDNGHYLDTNMSSARRQRPPCTAGP